MTDIDWRARSAHEIVDIVNEGREELERRRNEANESLELAFGAREPEAPKRGRPPGAKRNGAEFPDSARGALDAAGDA